MSGAEATSSSAKADPVLRKAELDYMHTIEQANRERVEKLLRIRRKNTIVGSVIGASVFGIYVYSMYAVKQETFLDDFDEPVKIQKQ